MQTLNKILAQMEAEGKTLPDTFSDGVQTISRADAVAKYGEMEATREGEFGVEVQDGKFINFAGWASRKR